MKMNKQKEFCVMGYAKSFYTPCPICNNLIWFDYSPKNNCLKSVCSHCGITAYGIIQSDLTIAIGVEKEVQ